MSWSSRRTQIVLTALALLGALAFWHQAQAQVQRIRPRGAPVDQPKPPQPASGDPSDLGGISLTPDEDKAAQFKNKIKAAADNILVEDWPQAVEILQKLLDIEEDVFAPVNRTDGEGKTSTTVASVKNEALRMIGNLDPKGLDY